MARRVHYVISTHWDRERYQTFQDFRYRLVRLLDRVLEGLQSGEMVGPFTTDGQAIILEDYLEVRPERGDLIRELAASGQLKIGPWYVLPDEFLVSGEALVRNIRHGRQVAREFGGEPSAAGFVCDLFGHTSQMPQILAGFGVNSALIWRGTNDHEHRNLWWIGPDGTRLPCYRFGLDGYTGYSQAVRHTNDQNHQVDRDQTLADLRRYLAVEASKTAIDDILMFDGGDHIDWDPANYAVLRDLFGAEFDGFELVHSTLDGYAAALAAQSDAIEVEVSGELREPARWPGNLDNQWLIPGVTSSRVWIKQQNAACQDQLCLVTEPLAALAVALLGVEHPDGFLNVAWRWLLKNHPHDSICGCSIDQVHEDMKFRFSQCQQIGQRLEAEAELAMAAAIDGEIGADELRYTVFNPLLTDHEGVAELTLPIPAEWPCFNEFFGFEPKPAFLIVDPTGNELAYQRIGQAMNRSRTRAPGGFFPRNHRVHEVTVALDLTVPAGGYTSLTVRPGEPGRPTRYPVTPGLATGEASLENEHLAVHVDVNGTLILVDKNSERVYERLLTFEDCADIGDGWYHGPAVNDQWFTSTGSPTEVALIADGPHLSRLRITTTMRVPARFDFGSMARSSERSELVIQTDLSLRAGADWLECRTSLVNTACDHRLRVLLPSGAEGAEEAWSDAAFDAVRRPIALRADNHLHRELEIEARPQQTWTAVADEDGGLAVISSGLLEAAVRDLPERPIALTLYRSTRRTVMTDGEPEGQLLGHPLTFDYWLAPLDSAPDPVRLSSLGQRLAVGLRGVGLRRLDQQQHSTGASGLPATAGYLRCDGQAVVTSQRLVDGAVEVRLFNPTEEVTASRLAWDQRPAGLARPTTAQPVDFESNPHGGVWPVDAEGINITLAPKQILTLRLS